MDMMIDYQRPQKGADIANAMAGMWRESPLDIASSTGSCGKSISLNPHDPAEVLERKQRSRPIPSSAFPAIQAELQERLALVDGSPQEVAVAWFLDQPTDYVARVCVASDPAKAAVLRDSLAAAIAQHEARSRPVRARSRTHDRCQKSDGRQRGP